MSFARVEVDYEIDVDITSLLEMIVYRRPARSEGEIEFIINYLDTIPGMTHDKHGNRILRIGDAPILWSSHTDTVHRNERAGKYQHIAFENGIISLNDLASSCLGADCTAGIWIMKEMIRAGVEGLYIFHRDEEVGGHGSSYIAKTTPELLTGITHAIAFDRKGNDSVITYQFAQRCCSTAFVNSIVPMLPPGYCADNGGTFTDTANYTDIIPECTNLSVGYENAHMSSEYLIVADLIYLRNAMLKFDWTKLVAARSVTDTEYLKYGSDYSSGMYAGSGWDFDEEKDDRTFPEKGKVLYPPWKKSSSDKKFFDLKEHFGHDNGDDIDDDFPRENEHMACRTLKEFITLYPDEAADYMEQQGYDVDDFYHAAPWLT